jgi:hypothetical protein
MKANPVHQQRIIRDLSYLVFGGKDANPVSNPTRQNKLSGPSALAELSEALRNPLPPAPPQPKCYNALEAFKSYKPLTMDMVRDLIAKERAARDAILQEYVERTGEQVDYCDECDLGVVEEEHEEAYGTRVDSVPCENCDGLGVVKI